jgi:hypothetical protein
MYHTNEKNINDIKVIFFNEIPFSSRMTIDNFNFNDTFDIINITKKFGFNSTISEDTEFETVRKKEVNLSRDNIIICIIYKEWILDNIEVDPPFNSWVDIVIENRTLSEKYIAMRQKMY